MAFGKCGLVIYKAIKPYYFALPKAKAVIVSLKLAGKTLREEYPEPISGQVRISYLNKDNIYKIINKNIVYPLIKENDFLVWNLPGGVDKNGLKVKIQAYSSTNKFLYTTNEIYIGNVNTSMIQQTIALSADMNADIEVIDSDYPVNSMVTEHPIIQIHNNRTVMIPKDYQAAIVNDNISQLLAFEMNRYYNNVDLSDKACSIKFSNANKDGGKAIPINMKITEKKITLGWLLDNNVTARTGTVTFQFEFLGYTEDYKLYIWQTSPASLRIGAGLSIDDADVVERYPTIIEDIQIQMKLLESLINAGGGSIDTGLLGKITDIENGLQSLKDDVKKGYFHDQPVPSDTWLVQHNLNINKMAVSIFATNTNGDQVIGYIDIPASTNNLLVYKFNIPLAGTAYVK